jgi:photosystem II stability/assembly factor-like uncharacterized protein
MVKCLIAVVLILSSVSELSIAQPLWQRTNGPGGSPITEIAFDSSGGSYVVSNGTYRSNDDGLSWQQLPQTATGIRTLPNGDLVATVSKSLCVSSDQGSSWRQVLNFAGSTAVTIQAEIYVATVAHVYRSTNEGDTWDSLPAPPITGRLEAYYTPTLFLMSSDRNTAAFYRSTDHGTSWSKIVNGISLDNFYSHDFAGTKNGVMFYVNRDGRYLSSDDGRTWRELSSNNDEPKVAISSQGVIAVSNEMDVEPGSLEFYDVTGKKGANIITNAWHYLNDATDVGFSYHFVVASPTGEFWVVDGPFINKANSNSSLGIIAPPVGHVTSMVATGLGKVLANASGDFGTLPRKLTILYGSTNSGTAWHPMSGSAPQIFVFDSSHALVAANGGYVVRSTDEGLTWQTLGSQLTSTITSLVVAPSGNIYAGSLEGVFRSTDNGSSWDQLNAGLTNQSVRALAVNATGGIFAGTSTMIFRSTDNAATWSALSFSPAGTKSISALTYNTAGDLIAVFNNVGVFWSHNNGATWDSIGTGLRGNVNALLSTPIGHVFAATNQGVFYLPFGGGAWVDADSGISGVAVLSITRDAAGTVYLGTDGMGVYRSTQSYNLVGPPISEVRSNINTDYDCSIYPNPASKRSLVTFVMKQSGHVRLTVLNELGQTLRSADLGTMSQGLQSAVFDADQLCNGTYTIVLSSDAQCWVQRIVIAQ